MSNVRDLRFILPFAYLGRFHEGSALWRLLFLIQQATFLEGLFLDFKDYYGVHDEAKAPTDWGLHNLSSAGPILYWSDTFIDMSPLIERLNLPRLTTIHICHCGFSQAAFVECMVKHASTLESLSLSAIQLYKSGTSEVSWKAAMRAVAPILALEKANLEWLQDDYIKARRVGHWRDAAKKMYQQERFLNEVATYLVRQGRIAWPAWPEHGLTDMIGTAIVARKRNAVLED